MSVRRRVILGSSLLVLALAAAYLLRGGGSGAGGGTVLTQPEPAAAVGVVNAVEIANSAHPDCRYSLVPGGVYSIDEVRKAIERDAVIAAHYAPVVIESLREVRAGEGRRVFVSYRIRNEVFWSREQVALEPGEKILTDGHTEIRARCGNLVSDGSHLSAEASAGLPALYNELDKIETDSSSAGNAAADDLIEPAGSGAIVVPAPDPVLANPGLGGIELPVRTAPFLFVSGGPSGSPGTGSSAGTGGGGTASGAGGSGGGGIGGGGGIAGGGSLGGGTDTGGGSGGGVGSGDAVGGADSGRSGGGSGGSGEGGGGNPDLGIGPGGPGSGGGGGSSEESNPGGPGSGNPGGPGSGGPGNPTFVVVGQSGPGTEQQPVHVPEPATLSLLAIGIGAAALAERRRARRR